jgi:hypothetical protein
MMKVSLMQYIGEFIYHVHTKGIKTEISCGKNMLLQVHEKTLLLKEMRSVH